MLNCDLKPGKYARQVGGKIPSKHGQAELKCEENGALIAKSEFPKVLWMMLKESALKARAILITGQFRPFWRLPLKR